MKYQLVLQFPLSEDSDFDALIEFETRLTFELQPGRQLEDVTTLGARCTRLESERGVERDLG